MKLSNCIEIISGGTPSTSKSDFWDGDIPWISIKDFNNSFKYIYKTEKSITKQGLEKSSTNMLYKNDIIISARGTVGCLAQIYYPMAFNQSCYGIRTINKDLMQNYLYYWLIANIDKFKKQTHGAVFDTITKSTFDNIEINYPSLVMQQHIVDIIGSLDDKIENNNKIIDKLWQKLQLVHTDFKSKNELVEKNILELADIKYGKGIPTSKILKDGLYSVYGSNGIIGYLDNYIFKEHKIAISCRGNSSGIIHLTDENSTVTSNSLVLDFKNFDYTYYFFLEFMYKGLYEYKTGSAQPQITIDNLKILNLQVPKNINDYVKNINDSVEYTFCLKKENQKLFLLKQFYLKKFFG